MTDPPPPVRHAPRIPAEVAYVVHPSPKLAVAVGSGFGLIAAVPLGLALWFTDPAPRLATILPIAAILGIGVGAVLSFVLASGGPQMACDGYGIWVRSRQFPARGVWLPWTAIAGVRVRVSPLDRVLAIDLHPAYAAGAGRATVEGLPGTSGHLIVPTLTVDRPLTEMITAIEDWSNGVVRVTRKR